VYNSLRMFAGGDPFTGGFGHCMSPSRYFPCVGACVPVREQGRRAVAVLREASRPQLNTLFTQTIRRAGRYALTFSRKMVASL
jgi:hypothetical protein